VPRTLASSISPAFAGVLLAGPFIGTPLVVCGALKIAYDLALLYSFPAHQAARGDRRRAAAPEQRIATRRPA
jgi:hypothetical protein